MSDHFVWIENTNQNWFSTTDGGSIIKDSLATTPRKTSQSWKHHSWVGKKAEVVSSKLMKVHENEQTGRRIIVL